MNKRFTMRSFLLSRCFVTLGLAGSFACVDPPLDADAGEIASGDAGEIASGDAGEIASGDAGEIASDAGESFSRPPNILLIIADDLGVESSVCYADDPAPAPHLLAFCDEAVVFDTVWSSPTCSPTRAGMLTGRHSFRTGIGEQRTRQNGLEIDAAEWTLPRVLDAANSGYSHASFGKWHLGGDAQNPNAMGWGHFSGLLDGALADYERWDKVENGVSREVTTYATTEITDDAVEWIAAQSTPWLAWVAYIAPHTPFHLPPAELHTQAALSGTPADISANPKAYFHAAVEALDTEMARLINSMPEEVRDNTTVIFIGDNGTTGQVSENAAPRAKESLYQGGIHVPLMVWGAGVQSSGRRDASLVNSLDLYATILTLAQVDYAEIVGDEMLVDSRSLVAILADDANEKPNEYLLSELFGISSPMSRQGKTIRDAQYKLIEFSSGDTRFYDLNADAQETNPLNAANRNEVQQSAFERLSETLTRWTSSPDAPQVD